MAKYATAFGVFVGLASARFGQEQIPIPPIGAVNGGNPGEAPTIGGAAISDLLGGANACNKLARGDQILARLGTGADAVAAAIGMVAAEKNFNNFVADIPTICGDPSLPANPILRGITPLIDPGVEGAEVANALAAATLQNPLDATGKSIADLLAENGFTSLTVQLPDDTTAAIIAQAGGNVNNGGQNDVDQGQGDVGQIDGGEDDGQDNGQLDQGQGNAGQGQVVDGNQGQQGNADQCQVNQGQQDNQAGNANAGNNNNNNHRNNGMGNNRQQVGGNNRHANANNRGNNRGNNKNNKNNNNRGNNNNNQQTVTQTVTVIAEQAQAAATVTVTAPCVVDPAATDIVAPPAVTDVAAPPAADTGVQQSTIAGLDFGLCVPTMKFEGGVNGRPATEFTFLPVDPLVAQGQQEALNPNIITNRICDQLTNVCGANEAAKAACRQAQANVQALGTRDKTTADAWNTELGFEGAVTNPAGGPAEPSLVARSRIMRGAM